MNELLTMLESKYKRLEYIQSTGTQWIDTRVKSSSDLIVDTEYYYESGYFFGYNGTIDGVNKSYGYPSNVSNSYLRIGAGYLYNNSEWGTNKWLKLHIENIRNKVTLNGVTFNSNGGNFGTHTFSNGGNITLGRYTDINFVGKIKYFNVKQNGVFIRQLIPILRKSDNEIGMLDLVEGKFYGNAGTGKFTANLDTMYAIIQGTPTVQDGRVSRFSSSNYLKIGQISTVQNRLERQIKIKTSDTTGSTQTILSTGGYAGICINDANQIGTLVYINGSYSNFTLNTVLNRNTEYIYKDVFENGTLTIYLYNYQMVLLETKSASIGFDENTNYNLGQSSGRIFSGTIDLNRSYIKIDDTKYKLQAVVGYSKAGTLTENPTGVFSGFSSANYVQVGNFTNTFNSIEMITKAKRSETGSQPIFALQNGSVAQSKFNFYITNNGITFSYRSALTNENKTISMTYNFEIDTYYYFKIKISNSKIILGYSANGTNWIEDEVVDTMSIASNQPLRYGVHANYPRALAGAIDMNETYIKKDNKLWFNGLEA